MDTIRARPAPQDFMQVQSDKFIKLITSVDGRDKLYKTIQYSARTAWWITNAKDPKHPSLSVLASLDSTLSEARKVFRLGGFVREYKDLVANKWEPTLMGTFKCVFHAHATHYPTSSTPDTPSLHLCSPTPVRVLPLHSPCIRCIRHTSRHDLDTFGNRHSQRFLSNSSNSFFSTFFT
jgi:hypothetical protein